MASSIFENDYDLPGVYMDILPDMSYGYDTSLFGTTDPVLIIGTAFNGPNTGTPMAIFSKEHASYVFGKVYDSEKQQESNLVAGIHDAWDRGCRTIYACRVGGKDIYKDFRFKVDSKYKFRVMSMFPSNIAKECYIRFDGTSGAQSVTIYKPAERATISQKRQGLILGGDTMLKTTLALYQDYGLTKDTPLVDFINLFNGHVDNNVIKLGIVDKDGNDVTQNLEVRNLSLGALFSGVYFIGREYSACAKETELKFRLVSTRNEYGVEVSNKPYTRFSGNYFYELVENTDIKQPLPIYADSNTLRNILTEVSVTVNTRPSKQWDWLETVGMTDRAFVPDTVDYEEVDLAGFDLYQRLGMGYAITAMAERRTGTNAEVLAPRIHETPLDHANHVVQLVEGYYSMLQDATMKYRVLCCTTANASTKGKLPKADDFKQAQPVTVNMLDSVDGSHITLEPLVNDNDFTDPRKYLIKFRNIPSAPKVDLSKIYVGSDGGGIFEVISILPDTEDNGDDFSLENHNVPHGSQFFKKKEENKFTLVRVTDEIEDITQGEYLVGRYYIGVDGFDNIYKLYKGQHEIETDDTSDIVFVPVQDFEDFKVTSNGETITAECLLGAQVDNVFVFQINDSDKTLEPVGDFNGMISDDPAIPTVFAEDMLFQPNDVIVSSSVMGDITFEELVDLLNENEVFNKIFKVTLTDLGSEHKDEKILDILMPDRTSDEDLELGSAEIEEDRIVDYNYKLFIPYRTTDNFARHFAQHCTYTELRTAPTWGFIGTKRIGSTDLLGVSRSVNEIVSTDFSLYAKNSVGRNMMDRNSIPYPIGRNLSIVFTQYPTYIETEDYTYYSNGAAGYAGMVSNLPLDQSSTNQPISVNNLSFYLTRTQHAALNAKGIVTIKRSYTRGLVITDGTTMAPADSVFRRLSASRIVGAVEDLIRAVAEPYVGKQNHQANRNSLHTAIKAQLDQLIGTLLENYQFSIIVDIRAARYNYIDIDYELVPIYEIRQIRNRIQVKESLTTAGINAA